MDLPKLVKGEGEWDGWIFVWHDVKGRLYESRFRESDLPVLCERLLGHLWVGSTEGSSLPRDDRDPPWARRSEAQAEGAEVHGQPDPDPHDLPG